MILSILCWRKSLGTSWKRTVKQLHYLCPSLCYKLFFGRKLKIPQQSLLLSLWFPNTRSKSHPLLVLDSVCSCSSEVVTEQKSECELWWGGLMYMHAHVLDTCSKPAAEKHSVNIPWSGWKTDGAKPGLRSRVPEQAPSFTGTATGEIHSRAYMTYFLPIFGNRKWRKMGSFLNFLDVFQWQILRGHTQVQGKWIKELDTWVRERT